MFNFTSKKLAKIRVVSYNVLSPNLATPASYPTLNPEHLDPAKRLEAVLYKIEQEINNNYSSHTSSSSPSQPQSSSSSQQQPKRPVIVCLQEVSYDWAGALHTFFANRGYHFVTGLYGRPFNGYMGVAMAWPTAWFETVHVDIARLSDTRESWPREDPEDVEVHNQHKIGNNNKDHDDHKYECFSIFSWLFPKKKKQQKPKWDEAPLDPWDYSERRFNVILTATLKEKQTNSIFCVATYHMPCAFYAPQVMTLHSEMAAFRVQYLAKKNHPDNIIQHDNDDDDDNKKCNESNNSLPYVIAGDWNIKPPDAAYKLLTTGTLSTDDPAYPEPAKSKLRPSHTLMTWEPRIQPMRSAYAACHDGQEPDFTNYAAPRSIEEGNNECFVDTLDYIFVSPEWKVTATTEIPNRDQVKGPFPNLHVMEPSDHILVAADMELAKDQ